MTSIEFSFPRSKMKCRSHKIDNCHKLSLRESVTHPFRPSSISALFFQEKRFTYLLPLLRRGSSVNSSFEFDLYWNSLIFLCVPCSVFRVPCSLPHSVWLLPWFIVQSMRRIHSSLCKEIRKKIFVQTVLFRYFSHYK